MKFTGTVPIRVIDGTKVKVKNRLNTWAIIPLREPEIVRFYDFFLNYAGQLVRQTSYGRRQIVPPPYIIETVTATGTTRKTHREPEPPMKPLPISVLPDE